MKKKLFILFLFSFMYSDFINVMIDFDPSYQMISVDNEGVSSYNFEYVDPGITLGYYTDVLSRKILFTLIVFIGEIPCFLSGFSETYIDFF